MRCKLLFETRLSLWMLVSPIMHLTVRPLPLSSVPLLFACGLINRISFCFVFIFTCFHFFRLYLLKRKKKNSCLTHKLRVFGEESIHLPDTKLNWSQGPRVAVSMGAICARFPLWINLRNWQHVLLLPLAITGHAWPTKKKKKRRRATITSPIQLCNVISTLSLQLMNSHRATSAFVHLDPIQ